MTSKTSPLRPPYERLYTVKEFCDIFRISRTTCYEWREKKMIHYQRTATGLIRFSQSDIDEFCQRNGHVVKQ
jgi:excisionase family DNA binding protein